MSKTRLTPRQKTFVECRFLVHRFPTQTDAYIHVYKPKGLRRTATSNASRIANRPAVQEYYKKLLEIMAQRAVDQQEKESEGFRRRFENRFLKTRNK